MFLVQKIINQAKYLNFANVFLKKLAKMLINCIKVNKQVIKLEKGNQTFSRFIYSPKLKDVNTFKIYIETKLANNFIGLLKLLPDI